MFPNSTTPARASTDVGRSVSSMSISSEGRGKSVSPEITFERAPRPARVHYRRPEDVPRLPIALNELEFYQSWSYAERINGIPLAENTLFLVAWNNRSMHSYWSAISQIVYGKADYWPWVIVHHVCWLTQVMKSIDHPRSITYSRIMQKYQRGKNRRNPWLAALSNVYGKEGFGDISQITADLYDIYLVIFNTSGTTLSNRPNPHTFTARGFRTSPHKFLRSTASGGFTPVYYEPMRPDVDDPSQYRLPEATVEAVTALQNMPNTAEQPRWQYVYAAHGTSDRQFHPRPMIPSPSEADIAGVIGTLEKDGKLSTDPGYQPPMNDATKELADGSWERIVSQSIYLYSAMTINQLHSECLKWPDLNLQELERDNLIQFLSAHDRATFLRGQTPEDLELPDSQSTQAETTAEAPKTAGTLDTMHGLESHLPMKQGAAPGMARILVGPQAPSNVQSQLTQVPATQVPAVQASVFQAPAIQALIGIELFSKPNGPSKLPPTQGAPSIWRTKKRAQLEKACKLRGIPHQFLFVHDLIRLLEHHDLKNPEWKEPPSPVYLTSSESESEAEQPAAARESLPVKNWRDPTGRMSDLREECRKRSILVLNSNVRSMLVGALDQYDRRIKSRQQPPPKDKSSNKTVWESSIWLLQELQNHCRQRSLPLNGLTSRTALVRALKQYDRNGGTIPPPYPRKENPAPWEGLTEDQLTDEAEKLGLQVRSKYTSREIIHLIDKYRDNQQQQLLKKETEELLSSQQVSIRSPPPSLVTATAAVVAGAGRGVLVRGARGARRPTRLLKMGKRPAGVMKQKKKEKLKLMQILSLEKGDVEMN